MGKVTASGGRVSGARPVTPGCWVRMQRCYHPRTLANIPRTLANAGIGGNAVVASDAVTTSRALFAACRPQNRVVANRHVLYPLSFALTFEPITHLAAK